MTEQSDVTGNEIKLNVFQRLINLYFSPSRTFNSLSVKPDWLTPLIISLILMATAMFLLNDVIQQEQIAAAKTSIMKNDRIPDNQKEQVIEQQGVMMKKFWIVGVIVGVFMMIGAYFLGGLAVWLGGNVALGKGPGYLTALSVFGYAGLVDLISSIIKLPLMHLNQTMRIDSGLGMLVSKEETRSALYTFLSSFDLFSFWQLALMIIGFSIIYKAPVKKSAVLIIVMWLVWVLIKTGFAGIGTIFS